MSFSRQQWRVLILSFLVFALVGSLLGATDAGPCKAWGGVWHVVPSKPGEGQVIHLSISTAEAPLRVLHFSYDFTAVSEAHAVKCDEATLEFDSIPRGKAFHMSLKRDGDRLTGEMTVVHPQFRRAYGRVGHRVSSNEAWDPIKDVISLADEDGLIDLSLQLVEKAPRGSLDEFEKYWAASVEPKFYSVVHDVVYGPEGGLEARRKNLGILLEKLNRDEFRAELRDMSKLHRDVVDRIKKDAPDLFFPNVFLSMPALGEFNASVLSTEGAFLVRLGSDSVDLKGDALRAWLAQQHLMVPLYQAFPPIDHSLVARTLRDGLSIQFASKIKLVDYPLQVLGKPKPAGEDSAEALAELKKKFVAGVRNPAIAKNVTPEEIVIVGQDFARQMTAAYSTAEILALDRGHFSERFWSYLNTPQ